MRATLEFQFNGGWVSASVDYSYGVEVDGRIELGPVTFLGSIDDITGLLDEYQREYMMGLCRKDWAHHLSCHERSKPRPIPKDIIDAEREAVFNDPISKARAGQ
jgi:hypothetical protein